MFGVLYSSFNFLCKVCATFEVYWSVRIHLMNYYLIVMWENTQHCPSHDLIKIYIDNLTSCWFCSLSSDGRDWLLLRIYIYFKFNYMHLCVSVCGPGMYMRGPQRAAEDIWSPGVWSIRGAQLTDLWLLEMELHSSWGQPRCVLNHRHLAPASSTDRLLVPSSYFFLTYSIC